MPFSCFLFHPRKSCEKHRKCSHTNVSNASVIRFSTPPAQTPHVCFHGRKWVHTRLSEKNRTQGHTRRNRGCFGWGRYHYPRTVSHVSETLRGRVSERHTLPLLGLGRVYSEERRESRDSDALMRVAVPRRRGPAGLRDLFSFLSKLRFSHSVLRAFRMCETWEVSLPSTCSACCRNTGRPLVKRANLPFSEVR